MFCSSSEFLNNHDPTWRGSLIFARDNLVSVLFVSPWGSMPLHKRPTAVQGTHVARRPGICADGFQVLAYRNSLKVNANVRARDISAAKSLAGKGMVTVLAAETKEKL